MDFYIQRFKGMERKEFEIEVITPMFLGGADKNSAELRAASMKGAMRFWWRAINGHLPLQKLKDDEARIFGDAGNKYGKSKVQIRIRKNLLYNGRSSSNPVPHKNFRFPCFNPGETFALSILGNKDVFDLIALVSVLGGLGKRSRRGFGCFRICKEDGAVFRSPTSLIEICSLLNNISGDSFKVDKDRIGLSREMYENYGYIKFIEIGDECQNFDELLKRIGKSSHDNNSNFTGFAQRGNRFSSPIYASIIKTPTGYRPIIATLNTAFQNKRQNYGPDRSAKFKEDILSGGLQ